MHPPNLCVDVHTYLPCTHPSLFGGLPDLVVQTFDAEVLCEVLVL